jgi:hypothetical protein
MNRGKTIQVTCAICGYQAEVRPRVTSLYGIRDVRHLRTMPKLWICDTHAVEHLNAHIVEQFND